MNQSDPHPSGPRRPRRTFAVIFGTLAVAGLAVASFASFAGAADDATPSTHRARRDGPAAPAASPTSRSSASRTTASRRCRSPPTARGPRRPPTSNARRTRPPLRPVACPHAARRSRWPRRPARHRTAADRRAEAVPRGSRRHAAPEAGRRHPADAADRRAARGAPCGGGGVRTSHAGGPPVDLIRARRRPDVLGIARVLAPGCGSPTSNHQRDSCFHLGDRDAELVARGAGSGARRGSRRASGSTRAGRPRRRGTAARPRDRGGGGRRRSSGRWRARRRALTRSTGVGMSGSARWASISCLPTPPGRRVAWRRASSPAACRRWSRCTPSTIRATLRPKRLRICFGFTPASSIGVVEQPGDRLALGAAVVQHQRGDLEEVGDVRDARCPCASGRRGAPSPTRPRSRSADRRRTARRQPPSRALATFFSCSDSVVA